MTPLCVVATGAVSPIGVGTWQHVMLTRAEVGPDAPGAFLDNEGETISCGMCAWMAPTVPIVTRVGTLAACALRDARRALGSAAENISIKDVDLIVAAPKHGWTSEAAAEAADLLSAESVRVKLREGSASFHEALQAASEALSLGGRETAVIVAADSWLSPARLSAYQAELFDPWGPSLPRPAEGAAAIVLMTAERARHHSLVPLATIEYVGAGAEEANDDNDAPIDGGALSLLLHQAGGALGSRRIKTSYGPFDVGSLRRDTWNIATARNAWVFDPDPDESAVEALIGHVGAASGALNFVVGVGVGLHRALPNPERLLEAGTTFLSWAQSRAGLRGLLLAQSNKNVAKTTRVATVGIPRAIALGEAFEFTEPPVLAANEPSGSGRTPPPQGKPAAVALDPERLHAAPYAERQASIHVDLLDRIAALLRLRDTDGQHELLRQEARILAQIDAMPAAAMTPAALVTLGKAALDDEEAWTAAGCMLALCSLDAAGPNLSQLLTAIASDPESRDAALAGLAAMGAVDPVQLGRHALTAASPGAVAVGLELLALHNAVSIEMLADRLSHEDASVVQAALRAWSRAPRTTTDPFGAHLHLVTQCLAHSDPLVRFEAARTLLLFGIDEPLTRMRHGDEPMRSIGVGTIELCVLGGQLADLPHVEHALIGLEIDARALDAIARFGHPGTWSFLLHYLDDPATSDEAGQSLQMLFGDLVPEADGLRSAAWRDALTVRAFDQSVRLRRGRPHSREILIAECRDPNLSRNDIAHRCDELAVQSKKGGSYRAALHRWAFKVDDVLSLI